VALAEAGLADEARAKVAGNLAQWPENFGVRLSAGDALTLVGDRDGALAHLEAAQEMARGLNDRREAAERIRRLTRVEARPSPAVVRNQRTTKKSKRKT
jgi:thioredoxin-like negative regulator of GroEL